MSWISTQKSLPEEKERVITINKHGEYRINWIIHLPWKKSFTWIKSLDPDSITHWRKLPKPPKV